MHKFIQLSDLLCWHLKLHHELPSSQISHTLHSYRELKKKEKKIEIITDLEKQLAFSKTVGSNFLPVHWDATSLFFGIASKYIFHCDRKPITCFGLFIFWCRRNSAGVVFQRFSVFRSLLMRAPFLSRSDNAPSFTYSFPIARIMYGRRLWARRIPRYSLYTGYHIYKPLGPGEAKYTFSNILTELVGVGLYSPYAGREVGRW